MRTALAYAALVVVGTLNREMTGVLLVLIWIAIYPRRWRAHLLMLAALIGTYVALRFVIGDAAVIMTVRQTWEYNTARGRLSSALLRLGLYVPLLVIVVRQFRSAPAVLRRLLLVVVPVYLLTFIVAASWEETRLLLPLVLLALPFCKINTGR